MTRLIDADKLKKAITNATYNFEQIPIRVDKVLEIIDNAPTVAESVAIDKINADTGEITYHRADSFESGYIAGIHDAIRPHGEWIPVSERLPKENGMYIVTEKEFAIGDRNHRGKFRVKTECVEFHDGRWNRANFFKVIAWQPLPERYEPEEKQNG